MHRVSSPLTSSAIGWPPLQWIAAGLIGVGVATLSWYHRVMIDASLFEPIIDEYMVTVAALWLNEGLAPYRDFWLFKFPGSFHLYAVAQDLLGPSMTAMRAVNSIIYLGLGWAAAAWFRRRGFTRVTALGIGLLLAGPGFYIWPVITPQPASMLAYALGCLLLFARWRGGGRLPWLVAGGLLFFAGWVVQTHAVLALATLVGAVVWGAGGATRREWLPWTLAGATLPAAAWLVSLTVQGQWPGFVDQAVLFVVGGYKQAGGVNDVGLAASITGRLATETRLSGKLCFLAASAACFASLFATPLVALWRRDPRYRALLPVAVLAPLIWVAGRTDVLHAFQLVVPSVLLLALLPRQPRAIADPALRLGEGALAFAFVVAGSPALGVAIERGLELGLDPPQATRAAAALGEMGVGPGEPVAVFPWAANLYQHGVRPGHRLLFVAGPGQAYHGAADWGFLRDEVERSGARWLAFFPSGRRAMFVDQGRWPEFLLREGRPPSLVGQRDGVELWRWD